MAHTVAFMCGSSNFTLVFGAFLREAPLKLSPGSNGHCPNGGGLNVCQDGLGHLFREVQMGNLLDCGGVKMLARMVWALMQ